MSGNYRIQSCGALTQQVVDGLESAYNNLVAVIAKMDAADNADLATSQLSSSQYGLAAFFLYVAPCNVRQLLQTIANGENVEAGRIGPTIKCVTRQEKPTTEYVRCLDHPWIFALRISNVVLVCPQFFQLPTQIQGTQYCPQVPAPGDKFVGNQDSFDAYQPFVLINALAEMYIGPPALTKTTTIKIAGVFLDSYTPVPQ
ncbi:hypothetical protein MMC24_004954 [Lignoscripta atroalba]|nr:hypothetical protein [Lignoscripta atroalba]